MDNEMYSIREMVKFATNWNKFNKEGRRIMEHLSSIENHTFIGTQVDLMSVCGYDIEKYRYVYANKKKSNVNTSQFRKLGILVLSEMKIISVTKMEKGYIFKLNDDWIEKVMNMR